MGGLNNQEEVRSELERIANEDGSLTPEMVVQAARDESSPLHDYFQWDSKIAAHAWRLEQARSLIRSVHVVITTTAQTVKTVGYVRDPEKPAGEQGYIRTVSVMGQTEKARLILFEEFSRATAALRRARELAIAFGLNQEVDNLISQTNGLYQAVQQRQML